MWRGPPGLLSRELSPLGKPALGSCGTAASGTGQLAPRRFGLAFSPETRYCKAMSAPTVEDIKKAIAQLPNDDKVTLATWLNVSVIREELLAADEQISRREGSEYDEESLQHLFAETEASALQLLRERVGKRP